MGTFSKDWDESVPAGSDIANQLDTFVQDMKIAIDERFELEHYALDDSGSGDDDTAATAAGRHKPGYVQAVLVDTWTNLSAITPKSGDLAYDTTNSRLLVGNGTNWTTYPVGSDTLIGFYATESSNQSITANTHTKLTFGTEEYDTNSDFASNRHTPTVAGYYCYTGRCQCTDISNVEDIVFSLYKNGSSVYNTFLRFNSLLTSSGCLWLASPPISMDGSTDYMELYINIDNKTRNVANKHFSGYKVGS